MMPQVSIIIPNFNHAQYLKQRIDTVLNQSFQDFELIILDDRSTDSSREIIEEYRSHPKIAQIVYNELNGGSPFKQWEKGLSLAKGEFVWIAESDDYADVSFLEILMPLIKKNQNAGIVFCKSHWVNTEGRKGKDLSIYHRSFHKTGIFEIHDVLTRHCSIQNVSSCIIRKKLALASIGGLKKYKSCGDWIFYTRVLQTSDLIFEESVLNYFRWYHTNISDSAQKEGLWITEGVDVLNNIDFKKVSISSGDFLSVLNHWIKKINTLDYSKQLSQYLKIIRLLLKYSRFKVLSLSKATS